MKASRNVIVLGLAAAAGVLGLLLKVTELGGPVRVTALDPAPSAVPSGTRAGAGSRHPGATSDQGSPGAESAAGEAVVSVPVSGSVRPVARPEVGRFSAPAPVAPAIAGPRAAGTRRASRARQRTDPGTKPTGSVVAAASGGETDAALGGGARVGGAPAGTRAAGSAAQAAARTDDDAPRLPPDVAYDSGDALLSTGSPVDVPDVGQLAGHTGTVSLWLQPQWEEGNHDDAAIVQLGGDLQLVKNVSFLRFELARDGGTGGVGVPIADWKPGEWHQVTATWNGNQLALYVDGQLASAATRALPVELPPDAGLRIGSDYPVNRPIAPAVIGRVDLRTRPLAPTEIARAYDRATSSPPPPAR